MDETDSSSQLSELGPVTFDTVREIAAAFPGIEEGVSYGTHTEHQHSGFVGGFWRVSIKMEYHSSYE